MPYFHTRRLRSQIAGVAAVVCLAVMAGAQAGRVDSFNDPTSTTTTIDRYENRQGTSVHVTVLTENSKKLDRQSLVKLTCKEQNTSNWQTTNELSEVDFGELPFGHYDIEVNAVGYLTTHKEVQIISSWIPVRVEIKLEKDPTAVNLSFEDTGLPPKVRKETKHGVSALKSGKWDEADKRLEAAYKIAPTNADLNFLLGYVFYEKKDYGRASNYLGTATNLAPHNVQALTMLGRVGLQQEDYVAAVSNLEKAVVADSSYWVAHDLLATSYLKQRKYEKARDQAQIAIEQGNRNATASELVLGQALVNLGKKDEGIRALKSFVQSAPKNPTVPQVKVLIAQLESPPAGTAKDAEARPPGASSLTGVDPMLATAEATFSLRPWQPSEIDSNPPTVASGVACPVDKLMQATSERAEDLVKDVSRIAAIEHLLHEQLDEVGDAITKETRTFNYVASVSEPQPGFLNFEEYRAEHLGVADFPDQIASGGFGALGLVFHPAMRDNFEFACEGLGDLRGQPTWLVHFRQRDDRPARMHDYKVGSDVVALRLKGRAWITADKFEIIRIESELVKPAPEIRLAGEHQIVEYGPVPFASKNVQLWLPQSAEIYLDFRRRHYYRKHSFDHYMLFSADASENRKEPAAPPATQPKPTPN